MATQTTQGFADTVLAKLADNKKAGRKPDSIRSLARTMGCGSEAREKTYRRSLFKWMADGDPRPSPISRALVAEALGNCDAGELRDPDDQEGDQAMHPALALLGDLMEQLGFVRGLKSNEPPAFLAEATGGSQRIGG